MSVKINRINKRLKKKFGDKVTATLKNGSIILNGQLKKWNDVVSACQMSATKYSKIHIVNDIKCQEVKEQKMRLPSLKDEALEGRKPDVLIIGGGISGVSIARD